MSIFGSSMENFHTCGSPKCSKTRSLGPPQLAWVLDLPIQGNTTLDAAMENYFFGTEGEPSCSSCKQVPVLECARLCRLPATLVIDIKRAVKAHTHHVYLSFDLCAMAVACVLFQGHRVPMPYWSVKATIHFWHCFTLLGPALHRRQDIVCQ